MEEEQVVLNPEEALVVHSSRGLHYSFGENETVGSQSRVEEEDEEAWKNNLGEVEEIVGYRFSDPNLLQQAFTHSSYRDRCSSYERLEYMGDSVLNLLITKEQYFLYPELPPGKLTPLRAVNVDTEKLARAALKYNLHKYLRHKKPLLEGQVSGFCLSCLFNLSIIK